MRAKLKTFGVPLLFILAFVGALFFQQLQQVKEQPHPDWSRSIPFDFTSEERPLAFNGEEGLFLASKGSVTGFTFNEAMEVTNEKTIDTSVTRGKPFWTDGNKVIQMKDDQLISTENGKTNVLAEQVTGISTASDSVYYWNMDTLFMLNPTDTAAKEIHRFTEEILDVYIGKEGHAIVQVRQDDTHAQLYYLDAAEGITGNPLAVVDTATNHHMKGLSFMVKNDQLTILYNDEMRTQGTLSYKIMKLQTAMDSIGDSLLKPEPVEFTNEVSSYKLQSPRSVQFTSLNGEDYILFTSESHRVGDDNAVSLYAAPFENASNFNAAPIGTTKHFTYSPVQISEQSIAWLDYGGDYYELFGASQNEQVIANSVEWTKRSVKEAVNDTVLMLFSSLITVLVSFYWVLPSLFVLILLYMFKPNVFEKEGIIWVEYASIILFMAMPFTFIGKAMGDFFYFAAPDYLTFSGSEYVLLLLISVLAALLWKWGRDRDWGSFGGAFYFMGIYILLYVTLIGPYVFNLF
ncbi:hypothetical protein [Bacillus sp. KH172YL63]|uniref:hypothetical protein n=1 Tax=Bacillus sp. KH172YL63 TaxID=2709784 RepID=UPI0013E4A147|nr:hypothetical protein [Bacillus sp. KH172YL63]BCB04355.1 hypothetical protein KH172YL63_24880 [Bacillus sp. KH172YL63]